jgi:hypothetical protein
VAKCLKGWQKWANLPLVGSLDFKLHLIINDKGEILSFYFSQGNTSDNNAKIITRMTKEIFGKVFGDKGYINKALADLLFGDGIQLITAVRRNMKQKALSNEEKLLLRKRSVIETVNDDTLAIVVLQDLF